jgi:hypothetical protein
MFAEDNLVAKATQLETFLMAMTNYALLVSPEP